MTAPHEVRDWVFTFGWSHHHPVTDEPLERRYVVIRGDRATARATMVARFGQKWSMQYEGLAEAGVDKFGLTELEVSQ